MPARGCFAAARQWCRTSLTCRSRTRLDGRDPARPGSALQRRCPVRQVAMEGCLDGTGWSQEIAGDRKADLRRDRWRLPLSARCAGRGQTLRRAVEVAAAFSPSGGGGRGCGSGVALEEAGDVVGGLRTREVEALRAPAAQRPQQIALSGGFHALGDEIEVEAAGERGDGLHDRGVVGGCAEAGDEGAVDLTVSTGNDQVGQRAVAGPEVVEASRTPKSVRR